MKVHYSYIFDKCLSDKEIEFLETIMDRLDHLLTELKTRAENAYGWMEGSSCDEFFRHEGEFVAYMESWNLLRRALGIVEAPTPDDIDL